MGGDPSDNHEGNVTVTDSLFIVRGEEADWSVGDTLDHDTGIPESGRFPVRGYPGFEAATTGSAGPVRRLGSTGLVKRKPRVNLPAEVRRMPNEIRRLTKPLPTNTFPAHTIRC